MQETDELSRKNEMGENPKNVVRVPKTIKDKDKDKDKDNQLLNIPKLIPSKNSGGSGNATPVKIEGEQESQPPEKVRSSELETKNKRNKQIEKKAGRTLDVIEGANILDYEEDNFIDPMEHYQAAHIALLSQRGKQNLWEDEDNPTEEYLQKKERLRMEKLKRDRGHWSYTFCLVYHITIIFNFVHSWFDSFKIAMQEAKFQTYHLQGVYNCMEVINKATWIQFMAEIIHALMSACVLFAETETNACLCMAYVFAQAIHTIFKGYQFFMHLRFLGGTAHLHMGGNFLIVLVCNIIASIVITHRYYDLTDRIRSRAKFVAANVHEGGSMNDEIIYQNQSSFLQRKYILRQAVALQVFRVIQKIEHYTEKGIKPDYIAIYRELHAARLALSDVDHTENEKMIKELKKANAKRLKELESNPETMGLDANAISGQYSKLFLVKLTNEYT